MAVFGYGRVGAKDQTTENQRQEIEAAGYKIDEWCTDKRISGKSHATQRPQFVALLNRIDNGDTLVVARLDCLGRDAEDILRTVRMLAERHIQVVVLQLGKLDLGSPARKPMLTMLEAIADMERGLLVERTQSGLAKAKAEGKALGRPSKTTREQRAQIITEYSLGHTVSELARRYQVSRASILGIVSPKKVQDAPLPFAWGD